MNVMQSGIKAPAAGRLVTPSLDKLSLSPKFAGDFGQPSVGVQAPSELAYHWDSPNQLTLSDKSDLPPPHAPSV